MQVRDSSLMCISCECGFSQFDSRGVAFDGLALVVPVSHLPKEAKHR